MWIEIKIKTKYVNSNKKLGYHISILFYDGIVIKLKKITANEGKKYLQFTRKVVHQATQVRDLLGWCHKN
jgi:hypothetical protein